MKGNADIILKRKNRLEKADLDICVLSSAHIHAGRTDVHICECMQIYMYTIHKNLTCTHVMQVRESLVAMRSGSLKI